VFVVNLGIYTIALFKEKNQSYMPTAAQNSPSESTAGMDKTGALVRSTIA